MSGKTELLPCPFCGGEASVKVLEYDDDCKVWGVFCESDLECEYSHGHFVDNYPTEAEAIAAWNARAAMEFDNWFYLPKPKEGIVGYGEPEITRTENGYKVRQIADVVDEAARRWGEELGEYVMRRICEIWNTHATQGTLTAEQVREAIERYVKFYEGGDYDEQAIADELNARAELGSEPPYDELLRCLENDWHIRASWDGLRKFWCVELTEEGVKLRDAARAERTCKFVSNKGSDYPPACSVCGYELGIYDCEWFEDGTYGYDGNYCPNCGCKVVDA